MEPKTKYKTKVKDEEKKQTEKKKPTPRKPKEPRQVIIEYFGNYPENEKSKFIVDLQI